MVLGPVNENPYSFVQLTWRSVIYFVLPLRARKPQQLKTVTLPYVLQTAYMKQTKQYGQN